MNTIIRVLGMWGIAIPAILVVGVILRRKEWRKDGIDAVAGDLLTIIFVKIASLHFELRPFVVEHIRPLIAHVADNSFPSDHLAAIGLACAFLWSRSRMLASVAFIFALLVAWARVAAHLHWPIDVITGLILGVSGMLVAASILRVSGVTSRLH